MYVFLGKEEGAEQKAQTRDVTGRPDWKEQRGKHARNLWLS